MPDLGPGGVAIGLESLQDLTLPDDLIEDTDEAAVIGVTVIEANVVLLEGGDALPPTPPLPPRLLIRPRLPGVLPFEEF